MRHKLSALFLFVISLNLFSQTVPQVNIPISVSDGVRTKILYFGLDPTASDGIDTHLDEMEQPPLPPSGIFDARFVGYDINIPELGEGVLKDYRNGSDTTKGQRIHEIRYQVGSGTTITISYNLPFGITGLLQDFFGGIVVNKTMTGKDSLVVTNPQIINKLKMVITYNLNGQLPPSSPNLISPLNNSLGISTSPILKWASVSGSIAYHLQVALDSIFNSLVVNDSTLQVNQKEVQLQGNKKYFWRVRAKNNFAWSQFSSVWNFTTIQNIPSTPKLHSPNKGAVGLSIPVELKWFSAQDADNYLLVIGEDSSFSNQVVNVIVTDTTFVASNLTTGKTYFWEVIANNSAGSSLPSEIWYFSTLQTEVKDKNHLPDDFILYQNFPNPFNSITVVSYFLPLDSFTKFFLYDNIGREIMSLDLGFQKSGLHHLKIDFANLENNCNSGGVYFYKIVTEKYSSTKKMVYLK
jgi:hypothetical protein